MKYKLIVSDVDGTLVDKNRILTERTVSAVKRAIAAGALFALATGRAKQGIKDIADRLGICDTPQIIYNGAMAVWGDKTLFSLSIDKDLAKRTVEEGHKRHSTMICWCDHKLYCEETGKKEKIDFYKTISGVEPIVLSSLHDVCDKGVTKILWIDDEIKTPVYLSEMNDILGDRLNIVTSRRDFLEFMNKSASKGAALKAVSEKLGISLKDCVAIGDGLNDLSMMEIAGTSVAMESAADIVKNACTFVTKDSDHDGVAEFLEKHVLS